MPQPVFHAPDHDHERCTADALAHAEALCAQRAQRLTPIRRQVLEVLLESHKPLGAYEIMDRAGRRRRAAGADHHLPRARLPARQRPRASHREPQRLRRLRQQSRQRRSRGVPDLRALRRGRRSAVRRGGRPAQGRRARRGLHAEGAGDRDLRRLRALPRRHASSSADRMPSNDLRSRMTDPASHTRPLDAASMVLVVFICLTWGFNQPAIKLALPDVPPLIQCAIRSSLATLIVLGIMRLRGLPVTARDGTLAAGLVAGAAVRLRVPADLPRAPLHHRLARGAVHLSRAVLRGARRALVLPADRFSLMQWAGLLLAFVGMVVAFGVPAPAADAAPAHRRPDDGGWRRCSGPRPRWSSRRARSSRVSPEKTLLYQLAGLRADRGVRRADVRRADHGHAVGGGARLARLPDRRGGGTTFSLWFALIVKFSASRLSAFTFLTPLFGVAAGHLVLGEPLTPAFALAVALVAAGLILVNRPR